MGNLKTAVSIVASVVFGKTQKKIVWRMRLIVFTFLISSFVLVLSIVDASGQKEVNAGYFKEKLLFTIPPDATTVRAKTNEDGNAVAFFVRLQSAIRLMVSGHSPVDYKGQIAFDSLGGFHAVQPIGKIDEHIAGAEAEKDVWLVWGPDKSTSDYLKFDSTGKHVAFAVYDNGKWHMVVDFRSEPPYDFVRPPVFSSNGKHYAYVAVLNRKNVMVVDGMPGPEFEKIDFDAFPIFSEDGTKAAYVAQTGDKKLVVVINHEPGAKYDEIYDKTLYISPNGNHVFYLANNLGKDFAVFDGKEGSRYDALGTLRAFSPDGERVAYSARKGDKWLVVLDGKEGPEYDVTSSFVFSPSGKHFAYRAKRNGKWFFVVDGKEGQKYDNVSDIFVFDPSGKRFAYGAVIGTKWFVVLDGQQGKECDGIFGTFFSADGKHFAQGEIRDRRSHVLVDGKERWVHEGEPTMRLLFSPDGRRLAYGISREKKVYIVVDGREGPAFDGTGLTVFSADSSHVAYFGQRGEKDIVIVDGKEVSAEYELHGTLAFSPDGAHLAFWGRRDGKWYMVVNGKSENAYDKAYLSSTASLAFRSDGSLEYLALKGQDVLWIKHRP